MDNETQKVEQQRKKDIKPAKERKKKTKQGDDENEEEVKRALTSLGYME